MRLWLLIVLVLLCATPAHGFGNVNGTITDSGGQLWFYGTIQFVFRPSPSNPTAQYFFNGTPFDKNTTIPASPLELDVSGHFSATVPGNDAISPAGSQWTVTVCAAATIPTCFTKNLTITTATQDISSQMIPPPAIVNLTVPLLGARAYTDAEVVGAAPGTSFFNITENALKVCPVAGYPPCQWQTVNPFPIIVVPGMLVANAMALSCAQGGGTILVANGTYAGPTGASFCNNVNLVALNPNQPDICLEAAGGNLSNCPSAGTTTPNVKFTYANSASITDVSSIGIHGITLDFGSSAGGNLTMAGVAISDFDMTVNNCVITAPCITFGGTSANNGYGNHFGYLGIAGGSEGFVMQAGGGHEWTVNTYDVVHIGELAAPVGTYTVADFNSSCDTQKFGEIGFWSGKTAVNGVIFNSFSTTADSDANSIDIGFFFTTAFAGNFTGTGITFNPSSGIYIKTGVMNWNNPTTPCQSSSVYCVAQGGPANSPNGTWISMDATPSRTSVMYSGVKYPAVVPTVTTRQGSGGGNYTSTSTATFAAVDAVNQQLIVTIPVGMKLVVTATGACGQLTAIDTNGAKVGILDGASVLQQVELTAPAAASSVSYSLSVVIAGDGASHTVLLGFATANAAHSVFINNVGSGFSPFMTFDLTASN